MGAMFVVGEAKGGARFHAVLRPYADHSGLCCRDPRVCGLWGSAPQDGAASAWHPESGRSGQWFLDGTAWCAEFRQRVTRGPPPPSSPRTIAGFAQRSNHSVWRIARADRGVLLGHRAGRHAWASRLRAFFPSGGERTRSRPTAGRNDSRDLHGNASRGLSGTAFHPRTGAAGRLADSSGSCRHERGDSKRGDSAFARRPTAGHAAGCRASSHFSRRTCSRLATAGCFRGWTDRPVHSDPATASATGSYVLPA